MTCPPAEHTEFGNGYVQDTERAQATRAGTLYGGTAVALVQEKIALGPK
jgi:hypothetical protein